jgi:molybdopterin-binding protein
VTVKLSARNIIPGTVVKVVRGQTTAHVKIDIGGGNTITSAITVEAVDDLALKQGDKVSAIIKSSDIMVGK